jgi:SAM-dependent methyltransferase
MPVDWLDVTSLSFNTLLLLESVQLSWLPGWLPEPELGIALQANPAVEWYLHHKCPDISGWVDQVMAHAPFIPSSPPDARAAEITVMRAIADLLVYASNPAAYDAQPFHGWDTRELTGLVDFTGKVVIDVGAGTGRLALAAAPQAKTVFAVEPVANLRAYLKEKARRLGFLNVYPVDGLITDLPFPESFADITLGGHVFGDAPAAELAELERVTHAMGMIILCPGNSDQDNDIHCFLLAHGFTWGRFEEPRDGWKRKYWKPR